MSPDAVPSTTESLYALEDLVHTERTIPVARLLADLRVLIQACIDALHEDIPLQSRCMVMRYILAHLTCPSGEEPGCD